MRLATPKSPARIAKKIRIILDLVFSLGLLAEETNIYGLVQLCGRRPLSLDTTYTAHEGAS